jgi:DNA-binding transcriptional LysR family regulator
MSDDLFRGVLPFVEVAEHRSFRAAAQRLAVTPAAVSKAVAVLETELGVRLLERTSRKVALTPEGQLFFERCRHAVTHIQAGRELVARAQREPKGELAVTLSSILGPMLVRALPRFTSRYPSITVRLRLENRVSALIEEELDAALRIGPVATASLVARPVRATRWVTIASPAYLARRGEPRAPSDLADHDCLKFVLPRGSLAEWSFMEEDRKTSAHTSAVLVVDQGELLVEGALAGLGIAQVLDFMVEEHLASGVLIEVLADRAAPGPPIHVLFAQGRRRSPKVRAFVDFVLETLCD